MEIIGKSKSYTIFEPAPQSTGNRPENGGFAVIGTGGGSTVCEIKRLHCKICFAIPDADRPVTGFEKSASDSPPG
jgi:hypothetical protein